MGGRYQYFAGTRVFNSASHFCREYTEALHIGMRKWVRRVFFAEFHDSSDSDMDVAEKMCFCSMSCAETFLLRRSKVNSGVANPDGIAPLYQLLQRLLREDGTDTDTPLDDGNQQIRGDGFHFNKTTGGVVVRPLFTAPYNDGGGDEGDVEQV